MRCTPSARVTVTMMGRPSGMAATARETEMVKISRRSLPCSQPIREMRPMTTKENLLSCAPSSSMDSCSGERGLSVPDTLREMVPKWVSPPVAKTMPWPWPDLTSVPM